MVSGGVAKFEDLESRKCYEMRADLSSYFQRFARKHDGKIFLFGYLATGGSKVSISSGDQADANAVSVSEQMRPSTMFNTLNVRHLFIDGEGSYNSGSITGRTCIVSGAFFNELDSEVKSVEELNDRFKEVREASEKAGFSVLRGMKERGIALPTENLAEMDVDMEEGGDEEEAKNGTIKGKDLISMAKDSQFNNFRVRRNIITRV